MMKRIVLLLALLALVPMSAQAGEKEATAVKSCEECTPMKPCEYEWRQGCNACTGYTYCRDDKWYTTGWAECTAMYCGDPEIAKPYSLPEEEP